MRCVQQGRPNRQPVAIHERVWEQSQTRWKPEATHALLAIIGVIWVLQWITALALPSAFVWTFLIGPDWFIRPWSLITSTLSHSLVKITHILFNGFMLWSFGPVLERIIGQKRFFFWFFVSGALAGVAQVALDPGFALGASGAIMFILGVLVMLMPKNQVLLFGIIPAPFWATVAGFALLDVFGVIGPENSIGNFAHLAGLALGVWYGYRLKTAPVRPAQWLP